jgi:arylsulfatase A-like enzyme
MKCTSPRWFGFALLGLLVATVAPAAMTNAGPNIILIYTDDLGYGDVGCYGAREIATPNIDRLAKEGLRFTDAHTTSATCTPSRYSLLTGEYAWRKSGTGILPGDAALIIQPGRTTLPVVLQKAGYQTGVVGKWHLGLGAGGVNWNGDIKPSPLEVGFDYSFIMAATGDRVPCVFVENRRVVGLDPTDPIQVSYSKPFSEEPTGKQNPELLTMHPSHGHDQAIVNGVSRIGHMTGGKAALWKDEDLPDTFLAKAIGFIETNQARPFFLYYATHEPHVPRVPHPRFVGKTKLGPRGDVIAQLDWSVGEILKALDRLKLSENTLVIFTSDNGPILDDGYRDQAREKNGDHKPAGPFRGNKYSSYEAGTRVPFLVRWPARVKPGVSDALVSQVDFLASFAALTGQSFDGVTAPDSQNALPTLLGESQTGRASLVEQGGSLALRAGSWKFIPANQGRQQAWNTGTETGNAPEPQLFNLAQDMGETTNVATNHPERVQQMAAQLAAIRQQKSVARRPNFVFILVDDLGYMDIGANNPQTFYETPHIDSIARQGVRFTAAYAASPVCSPTRASIMTGKYPVRTGINNYLVGTKAGAFLPAALTTHLALEEVTIAEQLRNAGYTNFFAGKWHLGEGTNYYPEHQGFDQNLGGFFGGMPPSYFSPYGIPTLVDGPKGESLDERLTDEAVKFIGQAAQAEKPFLLYLSHYAVHTPLQAKPAVIEKYREKAAKLDKSAPEFRDDEGRRVRQIQNHPTYAAMMESLDDSVGRVLKTLKELNLETNTVVIFMSDNGGLSTAEGWPTSNLPLRTGKGWLYEGGIRSPLFIRWPETAKAGVVCDVPVTSTDFYPTLLEAAGLPLRPKQHQDGVSLVPLLKGGAELKRDAIFWHYPHYSNQGGFPGGAMREGDWKLIERYEDGRVQLYNLQADGSEQNDLAAQQPERVAAMQKKLHAWYRETGAEFLRAKADGSQPWRPNSAH